MLDLLYEFSNTGVHDTGEFAAADFAVGFLACFVWVLAMVSIARIYKQTKGLFKDSKPKIGISQEAKQGNDEPEKSYDNAAEMVKQ